MSYLCVDEVHVTYAPLVNGTDVRIIVTGYSSIGSLGGTDYRTLAQTGRTEAWSVVAPH